MELRKKYEELVEEHVDQKKHAVEVEKRLAKEEEKYEVLYERYMSIKALKEGGRSKEEVEQLELELRKMRDVNSMLQAKIKELVDEGADVERQFNQKLVEVEREYERALQTV